MLLPSINHNTLYIIQIILSAILVCSILLQARGSGLSSTFGGTGGGEFFRSRRGIEKFLYFETIIVGILFAVTALLAVVLA